MATTSPLTCIEGLIVTEAEEVHDYLQLAFGDQIGLSIYNEVSLTPESMRWEQLVGNTVLSVAEEDSFIELTFLDGVRICIDMRPQAWHGPEALQLNRQGQPTVIWN